MKMCCSDGRPRVPGQCKTTTAETNVPSESARQTIPDHVHGTVSPIWSWSIALLRLRITPHANIARFGIGIGAKAHTAGAEVRSLPRLHEPEVSDGQ